MRIRSMGVLSGAAFAGFVVWAVLLWQDDRLPMAWSDWETWGLIGLVLVSLICLGLARSSKPTEESAGTTEPDLPVREPRPVAGSGAPPEDRVEEDSDPSDRPADPWS